MKTILIHLEDKEYNNLIKLKGNQTWKDFLIKKEGNKND